MVDDGQGLKQDLLDNDGCPVDTVLLDSIDYKGDLEAGKDSFVFKFADKPTVFFSCQLRVEPKDADTGLCVRTSDHCSDNTEDFENSEDTTSMVSIEPDFPRPSTPRFKPTTPSSSMTEAFTDMLPSEMPSNSFENLSENNQMTDESMMMPETTTPQMPKRKKIKARRPPRKIIDEGRPFPEFVGVQRDLGIRRKQPSPDAIEMDVNAGAMEVIDPPEICK
uniref:ZP domain-containing protein n=1 Tax=Panagrolaimus superbus TaxID=310955 RepID=A0A914YF66_9BILA